MLFKKRKKKHMEKMRACHLGYVYKISFHNNGNDNFIRMYKNIIILSNALFI